MAAPAAADPVHPDPPAPATTTSEENRVTAGQRFTNDKWEWTQQVIAIGFAYGSILVCTYLIVAPEVTAELRLVAFTFLTTMAATINQNYFTRTNHSRQGGVGVTAEQDYRGR